MRQIYKARSVQGLPTIRAYDAGARFYEAFLEYLDRNGAWWFCFIVTSRWIGFRLDTIATVMLTAGAMLAMAVHNKVQLISQSSAWGAPMQSHASFQPDCHSNPSVDSWAQETV